MCGVCGIVGSSDQDAIVRMVDSLGHRGPDDHGVQIDVEAKVMLGHTRLSIVDLSAAGHQPMKCAVSDVWISYNGEIYNHMEIRREIGERYPFRGHSDTETILAAYAVWGKACLGRLNGMFAFAIWDRNTRELWAARDRLGIKPLYYAQRNGELRFASEARAIFAAAGWQPELDLDAVDAFLRVRYVPQPQTLFAGVAALPPGHTLSWSRGNIELRQYWAPDWGGGRFVGTERAADNFAALLEDSVRLNLMSDVPLGIFLSGGLDSTAIAALAQASNTASLEAFSVCFEGEDDEAQIAASTARTLGLRHNIVPCEAADLDELPAVVARMDQPIGDAVVLPMAFLNEAAARRVKVVLTGEGADELLMGYAHQKQLLQLARIAGVMKIPGAAAMLAMSSRVLPVSFWDMFFGYGGSIGAAGVERMISLVEQIGSATRRYLNYTSLFSDADRAKLYSPRLQTQAARMIPSCFGVAALENAGPGLRSALMKLELDTWLPSNILTKQDTLGMAHGLEARVPYLDHRLVEETLRWDEATFSAVARDKSVLRNVLAKRWPKLPRRKKQAFRLDFVPAFRRTLVRLANELVLDKASIVGGLVQRSYVSTLISELDESPFLRGKQVAALVILEAWLQGNLRPLQVRNAS